MPGAREVLERIRASGRPLALFTNGSHVPPDGVRRRACATAGLRVARRRAADAARAASRRTCDAPPRRRTVLPVRHRRGARSTSTRAGVRLVDGRRARPGRRRLRRAHATPSTSPSSSALRARPRRRAAPDRQLRPGVRRARTGRSSAAARWSPPRSRRRRARGPSSSASRRAPRCGRSASGSALPPQELAVIGDDVALDVALGRLGGSAHDPRAQRDQRRGRRGERARAPPPGRGRRRRRRAARLALTCRVYDRDRDRVSGVACRPARRTVRDARHDRPARPPSAHRGVVPPRGRGAQALAEHASREDEKPARAPGVQPARARPREPAPLSRGARPGEDRARPRLRLRREARRRSTGWT